MSTIENTRKKIMEAEDQAYNLLWENLENFWVIYVQEKELHDEKISVQYHHLHPCLVSHFISIGCFLHLPKMQEKPAFNYIKAVLHRAGNLRTAFLSFSKHIYPKRKKRLSEEDRCEAENSILAIYVNIFGIFDSWALTLNECLSGERIPKNYKNYIGIQNQQFRKRANLKEIHDIWNSNNEWYNSRKTTIRDPFIHRTPPHIVPFIFTDKKEQQRYFEIERKLLELTIEKNFTEHEKLEEERDGLGRFGDGLVVDENNEKVMTLLATVLDDVLRTNYISLQFAKIAIDHIEN